MTASVRSGRHQGDSLVVVTGASLLVIAVAAGVVQGLIGAVAVAAAAGYLVLALLQPALALGLILGALIVFDDVPGSPWRLEALYAGAGYGILRFQLVAALWVVAVALRMGAAGRAGAPPFALMYATGLLAVGVCAGVAVGHADGATLGVAISDANGPFFIGLLSVTVCWWIDREGLPRVLLTALGLTLLVKALVMCALYATGTGTPLAGTGQISTSLDPVVNLGLIAVILSIGTLAFVERDGWLRWSWLVIPLPLTALILTDRRSYILGLALAVLVAAVLLSIHRQGLRVWLVAAAVAMAALIGTRSTGSSESPGRSVASLVTLQGLGPSRTTSDLYRRAERLAVIQSIGRQPLSGIGFGVPWERSRPLPGWIPRTGLYVHVSPLWFWMKMGALGVLAYVALFGSAIISAIRVMRHASTNFVLGSSVVLASLLAAVLFADTTAAFTGSNKRYAMAIGLLLGVTFARRDASEDRITQSPPHGGAPSHG